MSKRNFMLHIPNAIFARYLDFIGRRGVPASHFMEYKKWLRYFLDFCDKYPVPEAKSERVRMFNDKLAEKKQMRAQRERAAHAVSLYFEMTRREDSPSVKANALSGKSSIPPDKIGPMEKETALFKGKAARMRHWLNPKSWKTKKS